MTQTLGRLVDVYETLLAYDFQSHTGGLAAAAGADPEQWRRHQREAAPDFDRGTLSLSLSITRILRACAGCGLAA